jgi:hypothetical protein
MTEGDLMRLLPTLIYAIKAALYFSKIAPFATALLICGALSCGFRGRNRN